VDEVQFLLHISTILHVRSARLLHLFNAVSTLMHSKKERPTATQSNYLSCLTVKCIVTTDRLPNIYMHAHSRPLPTEFRHSTLHRNLTQCLDSDRKKLCCFYVVLQYDMISSYYCKCIKLLFIYIEG